jgi:hypothetical protein
MALKGGDLVGDRYTRSTSKREVFEFIVSGTLGTALTAEPTLQKAELPNPVSR